MRGLIFSAIVGLIGALPPGAWAEVPASGIVAHVIDGDTFALETGERVRLLDINAPEIAHDGEPSQPYGEVAKQGLTSMIEGKPVTLEVGDTERDRYGRVLAHVYVDTEGDTGAEKGGWVNGGMVAAGLAHVYTFPDNAMYPTPLYKLEQQARAARKGIWGLPRWAVRKAETCCAPEDIGQFVLVQGRVREAVQTVDRHGKRIVYLNFGSDYRTDFTVAIKDSAFADFRKAGITDIAAYYRGKSLRVRGYAEPVNGTLIRATHPAQIEELTEKD
jgi:endonuclease YncB( thermonuclease family)